MELEGLKETLTELAAKSGCKTTHNETMNRLAGLQSR